MKKRKILIQISNEEIKKICCENNPNGINLEVEILHSRIDAKVYSGDFEFSEIVVKNLDSNS